MESKDKVRIINIDVDNISFNHLLEDFNEGVIHTVNVDHLIKLQKDAEFYKAYQKADYIVCDSQILKFASLLLKTRIKEKIAGSDFLPAYCDYHKNNSDMKMFIFGGKEGVSDLAKMNINKKAQRAMVVDSFSPPSQFNINDSAINEIIINRINASNANCLVVGLGAPKQELWIANNKSRLKNIRTFLPVGAAIDFEANLVSRAPKWVSRSGLEWLYRLLKEPGRLWKRYLIEDLPFFYLFLKQLLSLYKNPFQKLK